MNYTDDTKKKIFFLLEKIEKKKIERELIDIKNLFFKKKENDSQLKVLMNYHNEYLDKINNEILIGVCVHRWKNYKNFISILHTIIQKNKELIKINEKIIENKIKKYFKNRIKLKAWQYLYSINKQKLLNIEKIREQVLDENQIHSRTFKKG